jgi:hypothetical protein
MSTQMQLKHLLSKIMAVFVEVYGYLNELESRGQIKMLQPIGDTKGKGGETFRLLNISKEG